MKSRTPDFATNLNSSSLRFDILTKILDTNIENHNQAYKIILGAKP